MFIPTTKLKDLYQHFDNNYVGIKFKITSYDSLLSYDNSSYVIRKSEILSKYYDAFQIQNIKIDDKETDYVLTALNMSDNYTLKNHEIIYNDNNTFQYIVKIPSIKHNKIEVEYQIYLIESTLKQQISKL